MTKQEEIEKIEKVLQDEQIKIANTVDEFTKLQQVGINRCNAEAFYNAGYRQEKEVAKEILQPIYELCKVCKEITFDDLNFLVMKYGLELE